MRNSIMHSQDYLENGSHGGKTGIFPLFQWDFPLDQEVSAVDKLKSAVFLVEYGKGHQTEAIV